MPFDKMVTTLQLFTFISFGFQNRGHFSDIFYQLRNISIFVYFAKNRFLTQQFRRMSRNEDNLECFV